MAYHIEHKGVALSSRQSDVAAYVIQGSVSIETAVAERPTAALSVRVPRGVTLAPQDFDEVTIDYPALPYRAWAERHAALVAYWRLDEAAVTLAVDSEGNTPLTYGGGNELQYRAFRQETIGRAVRRGAGVDARERERTLSGTLPTGIDPEWTIAGFHSSEVRQRGQPPCVVRRRWKPTAPRQRGRIYIVPIRNRNDDGGRRDNHG